MSTNSSQHANPLTADPIHVTDRVEPTTWNAFLERRGEGSLYHRLDWDAPFAVYGLKVLRLAAVQADEVVGVLPLVHQKSLLFGNSLVSLPWFDVAGLLAGDRATEQTLLEAALEAGRRRGAKVILRQLAPLSGLEGARTDKVLMRLELPQNADQLWSSFSPKVRNQVRKAEKSGLTYECGGPSLLSEFFSVYSNNMRDLGSPSHSKAFFAAVLSSFGGDVQLHVVRHAGTPVGCGMSMANGRCLEMPWASSLRSHNSFCVNHLLYWSVIQHACQSGLKYFHFGRSTVGSGTWQFKRQWDAVEVPLSWYTLSSGGAETSKTARPEESFGAAQRAWRHLPLWLSRRLGPQIIRRVS